MLYDDLEKDEIKAILAYNLKELRSKKNMTQEDLINDLGEELISLRSYKSYESGNSDCLPSVENLVALASYYECSLDYLVLDHRDSIYLDSFSKKDNLLRLCGLIYSLALRPEKDNDPNSITYGQYYFLSNDLEISLLIDKLIAFSRDKNIKYYQKSIKIERNIIEDYYNIVNEIDGLDDDWSPSLERYNQFLEKYGMDKNDYYARHLAMIERERTYYEKRKRTIKKGKNK